MQGRIGMLCLATLLAVTSARAQEAKASAGGTQAMPGTNRLQGVGDLDVRAMLASDIMLAFVTGGVSADLGLLPLGPGVLAVGGELEVGACVTSCLAINLITGWSFSHLFYAPHARATYHFLPSNSPGLEKVDLYGLVFGGITYTTTSMSGTSANTPFEYKGSDVGPSLGAGVGVKYFLQDNFFVGAEGRARWSAGQYEYSVQVGNVTLSDIQSLWSLSGINVQLFAGLRL
jgi:hypothetical protein